MDGQREHHDFSVCREGGYDMALDGMREAVQRGFRVTTNTTLFDGADPNSVREFFDEMMELGVEGMMLSPGYSYDKAPDQKHFLGRARTRRLFRAMLSNRKAEVGVQPVAAVPGIPDGQARLSSARPGACRRSTSSAGRSPVTCCRTATPRPSKS